MGYPSPIFVIGCPRSGTTMLSRLLNFSSYGAPVETHFIPKYYKKLQLYGNLVERNNFIKLINDILCERPVMQWKLNLNIDSFLNEINEYKYSEIVSKLCMKRFERL